MTQATYLKLIPATKNITPEIARTMKAVPRSGCFRMRRKTRATSTAGIAKTWYPLERSSFLRVR
ncbi:MAG: hypothetical protein BWY86_00437 [Candidatus Aminicenantes bacterium ADurb.Bin508]|nr:MAG: hypothetical protein BWY86_00437 [Candidatus Aminicenantes bacterium ADurb.Bin508]